MELEKIIREQFNNIITKDELDKITNRASKITGGLTEEFSISNILDKTLEGKSIFSQSDIIASLENLITLEVKNALIISVEILSICIIIGILKGLSSSFNSKSVADMSLIVCSMIIIGISINSFKMTYNIAIEAVSIMSNIMLIIMPMLIGILMATGLITSGTILSPLIIGSITFISYLIKKMIFPALFIATILALLNCLTEKNYVNKLSKLLRNLSVGIVSLIVVILTGIISIQGLLTETSDGILINTTKFSLSNFIPIVGNFTSDTIGLFLQCMGSIKSIVGIFGIIVLVLIMSIPIFKILLIALIYKLTAAVAEPVTSSKISDGLNDMGSSLVSIASILFFNSLLFIIFISIIINIGGS